MPIRFIHPEYLFGLSFLAIPVFIHLMRRRRLTTLDFSSLRFLRSEAVAATRRQRLRRLFLLAMRLLAILLLVLLFSQPFDTRDPFSVTRSSSAALFCWVDRTVSMAYRQGGKALRDLGFGLIDSLDNMLPPAARILCYDDESGGFVDARIPDSRWRTQVRHGVTDFADMLHRFRSDSRQGGHAPALLLFGDFQEKDTGLVADLMRSVGSSCPVLCVTLAPHRPWNFSVGEVVADVDGGARLRCSVKTCGRELVNGEVVVLSEGMRAGHRTASVARDSVEKLTMQLSLGGKQHGEVRIKADDPYLVDNSAYFVAQGAGRRSVLVVSETPESSFPIVAAFDALSVNQSVHVYQRTPEEVTYDDLDSAEIIVLGNIISPVNALSLLFRKRAIERKLVVFAPGVGEGSNWAATMFRRIGAGARITAADTTAPLHPVLPDTVSPLWSGFPRMSDMDVAVYRYYRSIPGSVLLRADNGAALVSYVEDQMGHIWIVCATPLGVTSANNLCETGFYVPLIDRLVEFGYCRVRPTRQRWVAGVAEANPCYGRATRAEVLSADGSALAIWDRQPLVSLDMPGLYRIRPTEEPEYWIAVEPDPHEGEFVYDMPAVPDSLRQSFRILGDRDFLRFMSREAGFGFANPDLFWIVLAFLLVCEVLLWKRQKT